MTLKQFDARVTDLHAPVSLTANEVRALNDATTTPGQADAIIAGARARARGNQDSSMTTPPLTLTPAQRQQIKQALGSDDLSMLTPSELAQVPGMLARGALVDLASMVQAATARRDRARAAVDRAFFGTSATPATAKDSATPTTRDRELAAQKAAKQAHADAYEAAKSDPDPTERRL